MLFCMTFSDAVSWRTRWTTLERVTERAEPQTPASGPHFFEKAKSSRIPFTRPAIICCTASPVSPCPTTVRLRHHIPSLPFPSLSTPRRETPTLLRCMATAQRREGNGQRLRLQLMERALAFTMYACTAHNFYIACLL